MDEEVLMWGGERMGLFCGLLGSCQGGFVDAAHGSSSPHLHVNMASIF